MQALEKTVDKGRIEQNFHGKSVFQATTFLLYIKNKLTCIQINKRGWIEMVDREVNRWRYTYRQIDTVSHYTKSYFSTLL